MLKYSVLMEKGLRTKTADKNYVDLTFITLVKNLATKIEKSYVRSSI